LDCMCSIPWSCAIGMHSKTWIKAARAILLPFYRCVGPHRDVGSSKPMWYRTHLRCVLTLCPPIPVQCHARGRRRSASLPVLIHAQMQIGHTKASGHACCMSHRCDLARFDLPPSVDPESTTSHPPSLLPPPSCRSIHTIGFKARLTSQDLVNLVPPLWTDRIELPGFPITLILSCCCHLTSIDHHA
jgi:hypothetical protein